jgi:F-type H+-transporting ATPase subunit b
MDVTSILDILMQAGKAAVQAASENPGAAAAALTVTEAAPEAAAAAESSAGVLETLGINWMWFVGQLINFGIVMFVLWKWIYKPVSLKLQERSEKIETALADADRIQQEKREFDVWKQEEMAKARQQAAEIVSKAQSDASKVKDQVVQDTKEEQDRVVYQARAQMEEDERKILSEAKNQIATMVTSATEKILRKKIDKETDKKLIEESLADIK